MTQARALGGGIGRCIDPGYSTEGESEGYRLVIVRKNCILLYSASLSLHKVYTYFRLLPPMQRSRLMLLFQADVQNKVHRLRRYMIDPKIDPALLRNK